MKIVTKKKMAKIGNLIIETMKTAKDSDGYLEISYYMSELAGEVLDIAYMIAVMNELTKEKD
nr:MAG TPA: hypothetical protein [Caudoviricetes sp.]